MEVREDDEEFKNAVDLMFDELKKRKPDHFAVRQYAKFKLVPARPQKAYLFPAVRGWRVRHCRAAGGHSL